MNEFETTSFEQAAVLKTSGLEFSRAEPSGRRVAIYFSDQDGKAEAILRKHENGKLKARTDELLAAFSWAKRIVFSAKDGRNVQ